MEAKVQTAAEVIPEVIPQPSSVTRSSPDLCPPAPQASWAPEDPMEEFSRRLEDILRAYGSAGSLLDKQNVVEPAEEKGEELSDAVTVAKETVGAGNGQKKLKGLGKEGAVVMQSLSKLRSPQEKLEALVNKYTEQAEERRGDQRALRLLQQRQAGVSREREQHQAEQSRGSLARGELESLCRDLQRHNQTLKEDTLQRGREDEEKRSEITGHFQTTLVEIQAQIEHTTSRNANLCQENGSLAEKLESLMSQYEQREQGLEKIFKHRDLQQKLSDAKLEQSNGLLQEAEDKHRREKEYLLREAIDKTKKCYTMKEQELTMKKKLTLYSQKFDEFQVTLGKSNDIYANFKLEMDKMTKKMKKLDKESHIWKTRFEDCNKTLAEMISDRADKDKEFEIFVIKIARLEQLCRTLQDERKTLYSKIREVHVSAGTAGSFSVPELPLPGPPEPTETPQEERDDGFGLTMDMSRLRAEQTRLQEFAASLQAPSAGSDEEDDDDDDDDDDMDSEQEEDAVTHNQKCSEPTAEPKQASEPEAAPAAAVVPVVTCAAPPHGESTQTPCGSLPVKELKAEPEPAPAEKKSPEPAKPAPAEAEAPVEVQETTPKPTAATLPVQAEEKSPERAETPTRVPTAEVLVPVEAAREVQTPPPVLKQSSHAAAAAAAAASKPAPAKSEASTKPGSSHHLQQPGRAGGAKKKAPKKKSAKSAS